MYHSYELSVNGVTIRPLTNETSEKYRVLRNRPDISKWFTHKNEISKKQQEEWFLNYLQKSKDVMFAVFNENETFIGANSIYDVNEKSAEYGRLIIDPLFAGKGYGAKATYAAAVIAKTQMQLEYLSLEVYPDNVAAIRTYQKVGFKETGITTDEHGQNMIIMKLNLIEPLSLQRML